MGWLHPIVLLTRNDSTASMSHSLQTTCLLLFVTAIAFTDMRTHRIPNALTVTGALAALVLNLVTAGLPGLLSTVVGLLAGLGMFLPFYLAGGFGAGDVKAMAAIGAFLGAKGVLLAGASTLVVGAVGGLVLLVFAGGYPALQALMRRWMLRALAICATQTSLRMSPPQKDPASRRFPYGVAIACGTVISLAWS